EGIAQNEEPAAARTLVQRGFGPGRSLEGRHAPRTRRVGRIEERLELEPLAAASAGEGAGRLQRVAAGAPHVLEPDVAARADACEGGTLVATKGARGGGLRVEGASR